VFILGKPICSRCSGLEDKFITLTCSKYDEIKRIKKENVKAVEEIKKRWKR